MTHKRLLGICIALIAAILGVLLYKLMPRSVAPVVENDIMLPASSCSPALASCEAVLPSGGRLEFTIEPKPVRPLELLKLSVKTQAVPIDKVEIDFSGTDMNMGPNRPVLIPDGNGWFVGQTSLPVCITGKMSWRVTLFAHQGAQRFAIPFTIETGS